MKYSIGDRVISKRNKRKGIIVEVWDAFYSVWVGNEKVCCFLYEHDLQTDLTAIEKPFGLLSPEVQEELKAVDNGKNIELFTSEWLQSSNPLWLLSNCYRFDPNWKEEEVKEMTVSEIEEKLGHKVKVVKEQK